MSSLQAEHQTKLQTHLSCKPSGKERGRQTVSFNYAFVFLCSVFLEVDLGVSRQKQVSVLYRFRLKECLCRKHLSIKSCETDGTANFAGISSFPDETNLQGYVAHLQQSSSLWVPNVCFF